MRATDRPQGACAGALPGLCSSLLCRCVRVDLPSGGLCSCGSEGLSVCSGPFVPQPGLRAGGGVQFLSDHRLRAACVRPGRTPSPHLQCARCLSSTVHPRPPENSVREEGRVKAEDAQSPEDLGGLCRPTRGLEGALPVAWAWTSRSPPAPCPPFHFQPMSGSLEEKQPPGIKDMVFVFAVRDPSHLFSEPWFSALALSSRSAVEKS